MNKGDYYRRVIITSTRGNMRNYGIEGRMGTVHRVGDSENWWVINIKGAGIFHLAPGEFRFISALEELAKAAE